MLGSPATGRLLVELMEPLRGWLVSARAPGGKDKRFRTRQKLSILGIRDIPYR